MGTILANPLYKDYAIDMCTSFSIKTKDQASIVGRTMEFAINMQSRITIFPKNYKYQAVGPNNKQGLAWQGKYGIVGMDAFGQNCINDGINETGLYFGLLYMPGFSQYQEVPAGKESSALSQLYDVGSYLLSTCATVSEVKEALQNVFVWGATAPGTNEIIGLHYAVHDAQGGCIAIEYCDGKLAIHDNPLGVLTNSPPFDWHMLNLGNYVNLSATNVTSAKLEGTDIKALGQGSGMLGLPGDFTPPSRFVRAVALTQSALPAQTAEEGILLAYHIVDSFDIPFGLVRGIMNGKERYESTQWITLSDLKNREYYIRYYNSPKTLRVSLANIDFNQEKITRITPEETPWYIDITNTEN